jgi:hypothetical protein
MKQQDHDSEIDPETGPGEAAAARIPGFINDEDVGLGDAIKHLTEAVGIRPCGECERRAARLNRFLIFSGRRRK